MSKRQYKAWFDEICLGKQRLRKVGNSIVFTVPKDVAITNKLCEETEVIGVLIIRKRKLLGEVDVGEELVKMTKKDRIKFQAYLKEKEELERAMDK